MEEIFLFCDGGSLKNPGPAGIGVLIKYKKGNEWQEKEYKKFIGHATNNQAEYQAVIFGLEKIKEIFGKKKIKTFFVKVFTDSQLLCNQMTGKWKISKKELQPLFLKLWNLKIDFGKVEFIFQKRENQKRVDKLVKKVLKDYENYRG